MKSGLLFWGSIALFISLGIVLFSSVGIVSAVGTFPAVDPNMVLYYHFNNDSSIGENYNQSDSFRVYDYSSSRNNLTAVVGSTLGNTYNLTGGFLGDGAFNYNGSGQYFTANKTVFNSNVNISISLWIYALDTRGTTLVKTAFSNSPGGFVLQRVSDSIRLLIANSSNILTTGSFTTYTDELNSWKYIVLTLDTESEIARFYENGVFKEQLSLNVPGTINLTDSILLRVSDSGASSWNGSIDDVIIYNKTLSDSEIWLNYHNYQGCITPVTTKINELGEGNTVICSGNYFNNGTTGATTGIVFQATDDNIRIDFNNSNFTGNQTAKVLYVKSKNNLTILNLNANNYRYALWLDNIINFTISSSFFNNTENGIRITNSSRGTILYNRFTNYPSGTEEAGIYEYSSSKDGLFNFSYNNFTDVYQGVYLYSEASVTSQVNYNRIINSTYHGLYTNANSTTMRDNFINVSGRNALHIHSSFNIIDSNVVFYPTHHGIDLNNCFAGDSGATGYNTIQNNNISYNTDGHFVYFCNNTGNRFFNNNFFNHSLSSVPSESRNGIFISGELSNNNTFNYTYFDEIYDDPILISGGNNLDFYNTQIGSFGRNSVKIDGGSSYIENFTFTNISMKSTTNYLYFELTTNISNVLFPIHQLTNSLIYFSNNSVPCSNINSCDENINITLTPNNYSYVLNNFNLTEGISRQNSPLNITSTSTFTTESYNTKTYSIDSDILNELDGLTFVTNSTSCPSVGDTVKIGGTDMSYTCSGNNVLVTLNNIVNGNNNLVFTYNGDSQGGGGTGGSTGYSGADEHLCYISFNYIQNVSQTDYSKIDEFRENYLWTTFREYLDNWQYYCSDKVGRSLKEDVICSRVNNLLEETKGNYELSDLNDIRNELTNHIKISNSLLDKYAKNYNSMCSFINKPLSYESPKSTPKETKITNQVVFFIIFAFIIAFGVYMSVRGNKKEKQ